MLESGERGFGRRCCGQCVNEEAPDFSAGGIVEAGGRRHAQGQR